TEITQGKVPWAHLVHHEADFYLLRIDKRA
ncbi:MAG: hypothetical protein QOH73_130, partial [Gaiellaceae bacterium]|nr:hypothetical protein [Gaiellaceae bacterium]